MSATPPAAPDLDERARLTRRPEGERVVMRQSWRDLLFLHWAVEPDVIQRLLPPGLTVDTHDGRAYIGLVPFAMRGVRPVWSPSVPGLSDFLECNVRTYVHRYGREPGVWFFSLDAANPVAVALARGLWRLPYFRAEMLLAHKPGKMGEGSRHIRYRTMRRSAGGAGCAVDYDVYGEAAPAAPGTLDYFLAERYLLYAHNGRRLLTGRVWHTPYPLRPARVSALSDTLVAAAGVALPPEVITPDAPLAVYSAGVDVQIFPLKPV